MLSPPQALVAAEDAVGVDRAVLIGLSMGGYVALTVALSALAVAPFVWLLLLPFRIL